MAAAEADFESEIEALALIEQLQKEKESAVDSRRQNLPKNIPNARKAFANNKNVKSDLKKSNAFVKKIKSINAEGLQQCIRDADTLNLTLFISEIVNAILATAYKATDAVFVTKLCISLHQKYEEFTEPLVTGLKNTLLAPTNEDDPEAGKKRRIQIRLAIEVYQAGLFNDDDFFGQLLRLLLGKKPSPQSPLRPRGVMDLQGLATFVKYGSETFFGFLPRKIVDVVTRGGRSATDIPVKLFASARVASEMKQLLVDTYATLSTDLVKAHSDFRQRETKAEKERLIHGSLTEQKTAELEGARRLYEKLLQVVTSIAECSGDKVPELTIEKEEEEGPSKLSVWEGSGGGLSIVEESGGLYGDPETRAFYEDFPDFLSLVPLSVLGFTSEQAAALQAQWEAQANEELGENVKEMDGALQSNGEGDADANDADAAEGEAILAEEEKADETYEAANTGSPALTEAACADAAPKDAVPTDSAPSIAPGDAEEEAVEEESARSKLHSLLTERLPECVTKVKTDDFCTSFLYLNSKSARKQLIQALMYVPRSRLELLPHYSRIAAAVNRMYADFVAPLLDQLRKEFFGMLKTKRQLNIESKIRNVRYQAELVKFRAAPPIVAFRMIRALLADFSAQNVQLLAAVMETCGRFLYLLPYTQEAMNGFLDTMLRLRRARNLDLHHQTLIESAYFAVKPPERKVKAKRELTVAQQYAKYLVLQRLDDPKVSVDVVLKAMRRLPWNVPEEAIALHVMKAALKVSRTKYTLIPSVADCLSGLAKHYPNLLVQLVDRIWEEMQRALDSPYKREMQRLLGLTRLLGELYNYSAVTSNVVFDFLYHLMSFGHEVAAGLAAAGADGVAEAWASGSIEKAALGNTYDPRVPSELDPATDVFRAQVACEMIKTVGSYFVRAQAKARMGRFLTYFQRYLLGKQMIPMHVEFTILDTFDYMEEQARQAHGEPGRKGKAARAAAMHDVEAMFPRFETLEAAQRAIDSMQAGGLVGGGEEEEGECEGEGEGDEAAPHRRVGNATPGEDGVDDDEEGDEDDDSEDDEGDDDDDSDSEEGDEDEDEDEDLSEREAAKMLEKLRLAEEDEDFERAFKTVVAESLSSASARHQDVNRMVIPAALPKPKNTFSMTPDEEEAEQQGAQGAQGQGPQGQGPQGRKVAFKLLSRDVKGRVETRQLLVPEHNPMAVKLVKAEEEQRVARERLKQRVLQIDSMQTEAEGADDLGVGLLPGYLQPVPAAAPVPAFAAPPVAAGPGVRPAGAGPKAGKQSGKFTYHMRAEDSKKAHETLDLDGFLAEANASEIRRLGGRGSKY